MNKIILFAIILLLNKIAIMERSAFSINTRIHYTAGNSVAFVNGLLCKIERKKTGDRIKTVC